MQTSLKDKRIAVTGGFGALGRALGEVLSAAGARVALLDRAPAPANLGAGVVPLGGVELGDATAAKAAMAQVAERLGGLDGLVNVAGGFKWETVLDGSVETWDRLYEINVRTA